MTDISSLKGDHKNARKRTNQSASLIQESLEKFGAARSIVIDEDNRILAGNGTVEGAKSAGIKNVRVIETDGQEIIAVNRTGLTEEEKVGLALADNRASDTSVWDMEMLKKLSDEQDISPWFTDEDLAGLAESEDFGGFADDDSDGGGDAQPSVSLSDRFGVVPFSVLNAREGWWQNRKKSWIALGIQSEVGREGNLLNMSDTVLQPDEQLRELKKRLESKNIGSQANSIQGAIPQYYDKKNAGMTDEEIVKDFLENSRLSGTSIFDPVLAELAYKWFSPANGVIVAPFAGGSVRGIVASKSGRQYYGVDLRAEQIEANEEQAEEICVENIPTWKTGDSRDIHEILGGVEADMIFSCPPYADLEVYSDDERDISTLSYDQFVAAYKEIIIKTCSLLKDDSFACFVIGEIRDKKGIYRNFVGDTINAFIEAGLDYYNEAILVTPVGTLAIRTGRIFSAGRKFGKTHQNVLVFVKGDPKKATEKCGPCDFGEIHEDPAEYEQEPEATEYGEKVTADSIGGEL